jgi:hypothetical protein
MAKTKDENGDGGKTENVTDVNLMLAQLMKQLVENQPAKVITESSPEFREMMEKQGLYDSFPKPVYQNGHECEPRGLSEETRTRAANLRPGRYLDGKLVVEAATGGGVHLKYKSRTIEDRMSGPATIPFPEMIDKIWAEMHATV